MAARCLCAHHRTPKRWGFKLGYGISSPKEVTQGVGGVIHVNLMVAHSLSLPSGLMCNSRTFLSIWCDLCKKYKSTASRRWSSVSSGQISYCGYWICCYNTRCRYARHKLLQREYDKNEKNVDRSCLCNNELHFFWFVFYLHLYIDLSQYTTTTTEHHNLRFCFWFYYLY